MTSKDAAILITEIKKKWNRLTTSEQYFLREVEGDVLRGNVQQKNAEGLERLYRDIESGRGYEYKTR